MWACAPPASLEAANLGPTAILSRTPLPTLSPRAWLWAQRPLVRGSYVPRRTELTRML